MKPRKFKKQGRDLNILLSLRNEGQKLVEKIVPNKKKVKKIKHKNEMFES